mmetsp:Transcript_53466/g.106362  ORF Transcript_53466/g.106362 Transcript_53466/m.106362 type:complete len:332 (-) Transcript_53466:5-1000(-)
MNLEVHELALVGRYSADHPDNKMLDVDTSEGDACRIDVRPVSFRAIMQLRPRAAQINLLEGPRTSKRHQPTADNAVAASEAKDLEARARVDPLEQLLKVGVGEGVGDRGWGGGEVERAPERAVGHCLLHPMGACGELQPYSEGQRSQNEVEGFLGQGGERARALEPIDVVLVEAVAHITDVVLDDLIELQRVHCQVHADTAALHPARCAHIAHPPSAGRAQQRFNVLRHVNGLSVVEPQLVRCARALWKAVMPIKYLGDSASLPPSISASCWRDVYLNAVTLRKPQHHVAAVLERQEIHHFATCRRPSGRSGRHAGRRSRGARKRTMHTQH